MTDEEQIAYCTFLRLFTYSTNSEFVIFLNKNFVILEWNDKTCTKRVLWKSERMLIALWFYCVRGSRREEEMLIVANFGSRYFPDPFSQVMWVWKIDQENFHFFEVIICMKLKNGETDSSCWERVEFHCNSTTGELRRQLIVSMMNLTTSLTRRPWLKWGLEPLFAKISRRADCYRMPADNLVSRFISRLVGFQFLIFSIFAFPYDSSLHLFLMLAINWNCCHDFAHRVYSWIRRRSLKRHYSILMVRKCTYCTRTNKLHNTTAKLRVKNGNYVSRIDIQNCIIGFSNSQYYEDDSNADYEVTSVPH